MNVNDAFPSRYVRATDLPIGSDLPVVVDSVQYEDVAGDGTEHKLVCYFRGKTKGLPLNRTNCSAISASYGDETTNWHGQPLVLFRSTTDYRGTTVPCLRVRVPDDTPPAAQPNGTTAPTHGTADPNVAHVRAAPAAVSAPAGAMTEDTPF